MDFSYSEEQSLLKDSVSRFVSKDYDFLQRQEILKSSLGYSKEYWQLFAELGWLMVPFTEADGGLGGSATDLMVVMEEFGKGLVLEPFMPSAVMAGGMIASLGSEEQKKRFLTPLMEGSLQLALCYLERDSRYCLSSVQTSASKAEDHYVITGEKSVVLNGGYSDYYVVVARTSGDKHDQEGLTCFLVPSNSVGISLTIYETNDGLRAADVEFKQVEIPAENVLGAPGTGFVALESVVDRATFAACAEAVGVMDQLLSKTVEYAKTRSQFGVAISTFQALQHRMADMFIACEQARSILIMAACAMDSDEEDAVAAISAAKVRIGQAARLVGQEAVQIHGGIGLTEELDVSHYFKRLTCIEYLYGSTDYHLNRYVSR